MIIDLEDVQKKPKIPKAVVFTFRTTEENKKWARDNNIDFNVIIERLRG